MGNTKDNKLTVAEAAKLIGCHHTTLRAWTAQGKIPCTRTPGGHRMYDPADLKNLALTRSPAILQRSGEDRIEAGDDQESEPGDFRITFGYVGAQIRWSATRHLDGRITLGTPPVCPGDHVALGEQIAEAEVLLGDLLTAVPPAKESALRRKWITCADGSGWEVHGLDHDFYVCLEGAVWEIRIGSKCVKTLPANTDYVLAKAEAIYDRYMDS